jgi:hypothetical protein
MLKFFIVTRKPASFFSGGESLTSSPLSITIVCLLTPIGTATMLGFLQVSIIVTVGARAVFTFGEAAFFLYP